MTVQPVAYIGPPPNAGEGADVMRVSDATNILTSGPVNQGDVANEVATAATAYATTVQANNTLQGYAAPSYYQNADALRIPNSMLAQPNGVATLDGSGHIPLAQCPTLGSGYVKGPYGPTAVFTGSTSNNPLKIADFNIGVQSVAATDILVFMSVLVSSNTGTPIVQVGVSNGSNTYDNQTIIAMGMGRSGYNDRQIVNILPAPSALGDTPGTPNIDVSYNIWLTAWLFDLQSQTSTVASGGIVSAVAYLFRGQQ